MGEHVSKMEDEIAKMFNKNMVCLQIRVHQLYASS